MNKKDLFIKSAGILGEQIVKEACWYNEQCNWLGSDTLYSNIHKINEIHFKAALGPDVYSGTSGISLFLAYLYKYNKDETLYLTSEGSIRHALSHINLVNSKNIFGFYTGIIGIAYVANKIGNIFDNNYFKQEALSLMNYLGKKIENKHLMDFMNGNAGAIVAILDIYNTTNEKNLLNLAIKLGDELILRSITRQEDPSWDSTSNDIKNTSINITGFSHGPAGIAYSLLKLYSVTNNEKYKKMAELAFKYENKWYNDKEKNWAALETDEKKNKKNEKIKYGKAWCHGAPGIGLSRLYAYTLLRKEEYLSDLKAALQNTVGFITNNYLKDYDFSQCHGLAGVCELLLFAGLKLNNNNLITLAEEIGLFGIQEYQINTNAWPLGIKLGQTPSLMIGKAGIGLFYLRLADPHGVQSVLVL
ncbi:MAG: lanthionine synthetase LanC family protein [Nitrososphaeraceae archaeon]